MPDPITPALAAQVATHLTDLQELLQNLGLHARLLTQDERLPCLRVINPEAATLSEVIAAAPKDGQWLFGGHGPNRWSRSPTTPGHQGRTPPDRGFRRDLVAWGVALSLN